MKMIKPCFLILNIVLLIILTSCVNVPTAQQRDQYTLNLPTNSRITHQDNGKVLEVLQTKIAPQFADISFVYRASGINYTSDYYNTFFYPPSQQINQLINTYLRNAKLFKYVNSGDMVIKPDYILSSKVLALYADYRYSARPRAVISIQFTLSKPHLNQDKILLNKTFTQKISLAHKDSDSLVKAWNRGLNRILRRLAIDLAKKTRR